MIVVALLTLLDDFYVLSSGDDAKDGRSPKTAWKTLAPANARSFKKGDRLFLEAGRTFQGPLKLEADDDVTVLAHGEGRPTIDGGAGDAIVIDRCPHAEIRGVTVVGLGRKEGSKQGIGVRITNSKNISVQDVEASGFQRAGIEIRGSADVTLARAHAYDNGFAGICSESPRSKNIKIAGCRAINNPGDPTIRKNHSGNGIVLYDVEDALIEYCEAAKNGWDMPRKGNGPVGIWCATRATRVTIQFCISHHNQSPGSDGGGFDFDGGVTDSVMQYNYSYGNKGWGYLLYEYGSDSAFKNNTVRFCVSENDGDAGIGVGERGATHGFSDCRIYNNVVVNDLGKPGVHFFEGTPKNFAFHNNIFLTKGAPQAKEAAKGRFVGNVYWSIGGGFCVDDFSDFEKWRATTGQEKFGETLYGVNADPLLMGPFEGKLADPAKLRSLDAYRLRADSPARGKGVDLKSLFGIDPGSQDFYGAPVGRSMGLHEPVR